jgi:hypothetical protein
MVNIAPKSPIHFGALTTFLKELHKTWPVGERHSAPVQTGAGAHTASYTTGNGSVPGVEAAEA